FLNVSLEVFDGEGGDFVGDCVFQVPAIDNTAPNFEDCNNRNLEITIAEGAFWNLQDFTDDFTAVDNCDSDLEYTQDPAAGTPINETTDVAVRVTDESGNTKSCLFTVSVTVVDEEDIVLNCPGDYEIFPNDNCEYIVPQFSEILNSSPAGTVIEQSLEAGSVIGSNADSLITITASFENQMETCEIDLLLVNELEVSCPGNKSVSVSQGADYMLPDYRNELNISNNCGELEIIQTPAPNTIVTEDVQISFSVNDNFGNSTGCSFNLDLVGEDDLSINCPDDKVFDYDEDCAFTLPDFRTEAEVNNGVGVEITQDPIPGTVLTDGSTEVTLSMEGENGEVSCSFMVNLQDDTAPVLNLQDISIGLDQGGNAIINFQDIDNGSFDTCDSEVNYTLSKQIFNCKNIGENLVQVTAEDTSGNISTGTALVTITDEQGFCDDPRIGSEYIFIYPNPNIGSFKIAAPSDEIIERVEVFDHRGRFIAAKDYDSTVTEYALDLGPLQEAVYVLKIVTDERTVTKRFIFKY
ncbi:MAG TPA: T9SS type A sorting domain-containing protein, partial [Christiangramia sp.]|nr:T9SS type A sorting domain-containing protein [Christiangramia sp.]